MKYVRIAIWVLVVALAFVIGRWTHTPEQHHDPSDRVDIAEEWYCSMHPNFRQPEPGKCGICGMNLVRAEPTKGWKLTMSEKERALARIQTAPVTREFLTKNVRMVGKVDYDETRMRTISAWVPGRLVRVYVDYTGIRVRQGDHLVKLYSPELLTAQEELLEAKKRLVAAGEEVSEFLRQSNKRAYASARDKLLLFGLSEEQLRKIEKSGKGEDHITINSPSGGIVIHKGVNQGDYVKTGDKIYQIAELDHLWIRLDAYEQDLRWIRYGQKVSVEAEALPGETFPGWISFIDPIVESRSRTVRVRVNVKNPDGKLKPGMFVRAVVRAGIAAGGRTMDPRLAGKWVSPMHPEIVKDGPGKCDICGMDLVPAETLGYVSSADKGSAPVVVLATAVLITGKRAVVYVEVPDAEIPTYQGRVVRLGPRAGDHYIVVDGLEAGERVVVNGAFRIDSAMQIMAKPNMMSQRGDYLKVSWNPQGFYAAYFGIQKALAEDSLKAAGSGFQQLASALAKVDEESLPKELQDHFKQLANHTKLGAAPASLKAARERFHEVSIALLAVHEAIGHGGDATWFRMHCPMAFDNSGADWLQDHDKIDNPYFGSEMLRCGEIKKRYLGRGDR